MNITTIICPVCKQELETDPGQVIPRSTRLECPECGAGFSPKTALAIARRNSGGTAPGEAMAAATVVARCAIMGVAIILFAAGLLCWPLWIPAAVLAILALLLK